MKKPIENQERVETGRDNKQFNLELIKESEKAEVQQEQLVEEGDLKKKDEVQAYKPPISFPQRL